MERAAPVRSSHTSTAGLLAWPHPDGAGSLPARRPNQPTEEFRKVVFGEQQVAEGAGGLNKTKMRTTGSAPKSKETTGIGKSKAEIAAVATASRDRQASQITFSQDGTIAPRKPTSVAGVARQRELSHSVESEGDSKMKRQVSIAKSKELSGHDIFADHEDPKPNRSKRSDYGRLGSSALPVKNANVSSFSFGEADMGSTVKTAMKKGSSNKTTDLNGKAITERDSAPAEKQPLNRTKPKGITGGSIFADVKASTTGDQAGRRPRQPPGGDSSILLG